jgi:hypothetical protein
MKNLLLFVISILLSYPSFSQKKNPAEEFKVSWGTPYEIPKKYEDLGYLSNLEDGILQISVKLTTDVIIQRFDLKKLSPTNRLTIDLSKKPGHFIPDMFTDFNGQFYMIYSTWDKEAEREHLFADKIDLKKGAFAENPKELINAKKIAGDLIATGFYKFSTAGKYKFHFSIDSSYMLVTYRMYTDVKNDAVSKDVIGFYMFDKDLNKVWSNEVRMPYTEEMMDNIDYTVTSKGEAYLLCKVYEGKRVEKRKDNPNYHFEVMKFGPGGSEAKPIRIRLADKFINDMILSEGFGGEIICAGYYKSDFKTTGGNANKYIHTDGCVLATIDQNDSVLMVSKGFYEFPAETIKAFERQSDQNKVDKKDEKDKAEAPSLYLRNVLISNDGSITFIGEQYRYVISTSTSATGSVSTHERWYYGDIFVMKIGPDGNMAWVTKIPKNQQGAKGRRGMSFKHYWHAGNDYFFYLDNIKNMNLQPTAVPAVHMDGAGGFLTVCKIDKDGNISKGNLMNLKDEELQVWPADLDMISDKLILGRGFDGSRSKMLKIEMQ